MASCPCLRPTTMLQAGHSFLPQRRLESDAELVAATTTAGGPFLSAATKIRIGHGPRCRDSRCRRNHSSLRLRRIESDAEHRCRNNCCRRNHSPLASIRKSELEIKNRYTQEGLNREKLTSIPKSGPEIKNHCTQEGVNRQNPAVIPKLTP